MVQQSFDAKIGERPVRPSEYRLRNRFILGCVVEQLWENRDGARFWRRVHEFRLIPPGRILGGE